MAFKILVCGGRSYNEWAKFCEVMNGVMEEFGCVTHIIQGGAEGADKYAYRYAIINGVQPVECLPNWGHYGKKAGHMRNYFMLDLKPDLVIAFPGGKGTANMISQAIKRGVPVRTV